MPNLVALGLKVSDKKIFKYIEYFKFCCQGNQFLKELNSFKEFWRRPWEEHLCEISSKLDE